MAERKSRQIKISFEQAEQFRTIHVDGAWGGVTPQGGIAVNFYHEHHAVPSSLTITMKEGQTPTERRSGPAAIVRVLEAEARMTPDVARTLGEWLLGKADEAERLLSAAQELRSTETDSSADPSGGA